MKIVQVIDQLNVGGAERVLVDLSNILHENGHDVTVLCLLDKAKLDHHLNNDIPVVYLKRKNKYNPIYLFRLYRMLSRFDIIHIHLRQVVRYISLLFYVTQIAKKKVVIFHDHYGRINEDKRISTSLKNALKKCTAYIGVSEQLKEWAASTSVNQNTFKLSNIVRAGSVNQDSSLPLNKVNVVSVGNFRPQKNYQFLVDLIKGLPQNYHFTIYGQIIDVNYYKSILELIDQYQISDRVTIVTDCNDIQSKLSQYHIAIHCAASETGPLVAIEYMSMQIPFIAYNTGEVATQVKGTFPSFIQDNFDVNTWIERIEDILVKRDTFVEQISNFYDKNYSEENYLSQCIAIYKTLLKSKNGA